MCVQCIYMYILTCTGILPECLFPSMPISANLTNNKNSLMCILRFHARAGYLQHYETLLKELNEHPASDPVPPDQNEVESASLADRNLNLPCESGIRFPSYMVMLLRRHTQSKITVILCLVHVYTLYVHVFCSDIHGICMFVFVYHSQMVFCAGHL